VRDLRIRFGNETLRQERERELEVAKREAWHAEFWANVLEGTLGWSPEIEPWRPPPKLTSESGGISTIGTDCSNRSMWHDMLCRAGFVTGRLSTGKSSPPSAWYNLP